MLEVERVNALCLGDFVIRLRSYCIAYAPTIGRFFEIVDINCVNVGHHKKDPKILEMGLKLIVLSSVLFGYKTKSCCCVIKQNDEKSPWMGFRAYAIRPYTITEYTDFV